MRAPTPAEQGILFDATGHAFRVGAYGDTAWHGASQDHELKVWSPTPASADATNLPEVDLLRARDLARGEPIADTTTSAFDHNVVGANGMRVTATPDYVALSFTHRTPGCCMTRWTYPRGKFPYAFRGASLPGIRGPSLVVA